MGCFQTWFSSLDISKFLAGVDGLDMTNDGTIHQVVGDQKENILALPNDNEGFATALLERLGESARLAISRQTVLVIMVFAPITPEQDICVDLAGRRIYLTVECLRQTIKDATGEAQLPVMLLTPSPFTGGWMCRPSFTGRSVCRVSKMWRIIAGSCSGAFANRFIRSFTERNTPLMTEAQREKVKYDDPMPLRPTELQTNCLHQFQRKIHESLEHRHSIFAKDHAFILEPKAARDLSTFSDTWTEYGHRQGHSLNFWAGRWNTSRPTINDAHRFEFLGEAFGGTKESQFFHLKYLAAIELETYPGDWGRQVGGITRELLTTFSQKLTPSEDDAKRVFDTIEFRVSSMILAQMVAKAFELPLPDGVTCRYWHDKMDGVNDEYYRKLQFAFGEALNLFGQVAVLPSEKTHEYKNVRYWRAARWLSAAVALQFEDGSRQDIEDFVSKDVARFIAKIRDTQNILLSEDREVVRAGLNWIAALGLGGEVQAVASKTTIPETEVVQEPARETGVSGWNNQQPAVRSAPLDAQAAPWPINAAERKPSTKSSAVVFAGADSSLLQGDIQLAVEDLLEKFEVKSEANNNKRHETQVLATAATPLREAKFEAQVPGNGPLFANTDPRLQIPANSGFSFNNGKFHASLFGDNSADHQVRPTNNVSAPNNIDRKMAAPAAADNGAGTCDTTITTPVAPDNERENGRIQDIFLNLSEDLLKQAEQKVNKPAVLSETKSTTPKHAAAAQSVVQQAVAQLTKSILGVMSNGSVDETVDASDAQVMQVARVIQKAAELIKQEQAKKASVPENETPVAENASCLTLASGSVCVASGASTTEEPDAGSGGLLVTSCGDTSWDPTSCDPAHEDREGNEATETRTGKTAAFLPWTYGRFTEKRSADSDWFNATSWRPGHGRGEGNEPTGICAEKTAALLSDRPVLSNAVTLGNSRIGSLSHGMEDSDIHDLISWRTPASKVLGDKTNSGQLTKGEKGVGTALPAAAQETTSSNAAAGPAAERCLAGDDFWARAGIDW